MPTVLMAAPPIRGRVESVAGTAAGLVSRGHLVTVLTGPDYRPLIEEAGAAFAPLPAEADHVKIGADAGGPAQSTGNAVHEETIRQFIRPIPAQFAALSELLRIVHFDALLVESMFLGALPLVLGPTPHRRPPVFALSAAPLTLSDADTAPFGLGLTPGTGPLARVRNRALHALTRTVLDRRLATALTEALTSCGVASSLWIHDTARAFDRTFQLTHPELEYPRRRLPRSVSFLGPLVTAAPRPSDLPAGWDQITGAIVHVTQGTIDNEDPSRLIVPTIRALAGDPVTVVATTGGRDVTSVLDHFPDGLPANAIVTEYLPYERLLPRTDAVVTNGGFGGVQHALRHGIPLVVAADTGDKPEIAARVGWAEVGIDLHTGAPGEDAIAAAVRRVLGDARYRENAQRLAALAPRIDPVDVIVDAIAEATTVPLTRRARNRS